MNTEGPMNLDDDVTTETETPDLPTRDADDVPICPVHYVRMKIYSSKGKSIGHYQCPDKACKESGKKLNTKNVPPNLHKCPSCANKQRDVSCVVNPRATTPFHVVLHCPECNWGGLSFARPTNK